MSEKKYYEITVDTIYSNQYYVLADSQEDAEKLAKDKAWNNHHGESILDVSVHDTYINDNPEYPDDYEEI
jgi:proline racemase